MEPYVHKREFSVRYCDVDFKDELKPSAALSYMEEIACSSADELGFGYAYVKPRGYAFMITNICAEFDAPVPLGESLCARTWPTPPAHVIFGREYQFFSPQGKRYMNATSRWCVVDMRTGKLLPVKVIDNQDYSSYNTEKLFEKVVWKLPVFKKEEGELRFSIKIANSEYDHNMHVNNTRYADYCFNCFTVEELAKKQLKKFTIAYIRQCREGETLRFYRKTEGEGYVVQGFNDGDEVVVQAQIAFA